MPENLDFGTLADKATNAKNSARQAPAQAEYKIIGQPEVNVKELDIVKEMTFAKNSPEPKHKVASLPLNG